MNEMKILMIGNKNSGKTTYMTSSYGLLRDGKFGFTVSAESDIDSMLINNFCLLRDSGKYPSPSSSRQVYEFVLSYSGKPILNFEWLDYYGGIINDTKTNELPNDIEGADAAMLFVEGKALLQNDREVTQLRRILYLIGRKIINRNKERLFTVIVVVTKYDEVPASASFEEVCRPLGDFLEAVKGKEGVYCSVVPVSCTSRRFVNVDLPLIDVLDSGMATKFFGHASAAYDHYMNGQKLQERVGFFRRTLEIFVPFIDYDEDVRARREYGEAIEYINLMEEIQEPFEKLREYRNSYSIVLPNRYSLAGKSRREQFGLL